MSLIPDAAETTLAPEEVSVVSLWAGAGTTPGWPPPGDAGLVAPSGTAAAWEEALCAAESADYSRAAWARVPLCR